MAIECGEQRLGLMGLSTRGVDAGMRAVDCVGGAERDRLPGDCRD